MATVEQNMEKLIRSVSYTRTSGLEVFGARVKAVDRKRRTCDVVVDDNLTLYGCRLNAVVDDYENAVLAVPAMDSVVAVQALNGDMKNLIVVSVSEIESVNVAVGEMSVSISERDVVFNGGDNGGLVKVSEMVSWMLKVSTDMQTLKTQLSAWPVAGNGAPLGLVFSPATPTPKVADFEDKKVKH
jgi:hypothetical protein